MNNFGEVLFHYSVEQKKILRKIENLNKKIINAENAVIFNSVCIKENLLPTYTNIRLHDRAVQHAQLTSDFRKKLLEEQILSNQTKSNNLKIELHQYIQLFEAFDISSVLRARTQELLQSLITAYGNARQTGVLKKLTKLYGGTLALPAPTARYINLSSYVLNDAEKEFLNLGLNCHVSPRYKQIDKKVNIAVLYEQLCELQKDNKISVNPNIREQLQAEAT